MNWFVYFLVSGGGFFLGAALVLVAVLLGLSSRVGYQRAATLLCFIGLILVAVSGTPLADQFYGLAGFASLLWLIVFRTVKFKKIAYFATALCAGSWIIGLAMEIPWHQIPKLQPSKQRTVTVVADSVTAGMGEKETKSWPVLLSEDHQLEVRDISQAGASVASALKQVQAATLTPGVVVVEIGGNDLLGSTHVSDFARDLDALLKALKSPERQVVMFELPLPPFENRWGQVQRFLAKQHGVLLIPKRVFMGVLAGNGATLDSIHLTPDGHRKMEQAVWEIVRPAFE